MKEYGPPEVLVAGEAPDPVAGEGQVVVEVAFANITFVETQIRSGSLRIPGAAADLPTIPGNGVGGTVRSVGPGVDPGLVGKRVVTGTGGSGGYAEQVSVPAAGVIEVPDGLPLDTAVALLADGRTATALYRSAAPRAGERVLIEAAAGGVGSLLVQLVTLAEATAVATAGAPHKLDQARELGAQFAFDYTKPDWATQVRETVGEIDVVFDGVGGDIGRAAFELLAPGGRMFSFGMAAGAFPEIDEAEVVARGVTVRRGVPVTPDQARALTTSALEEAAAGNLRPVIGQRFALDEARRAHAAIEGRATLGKTLLVP
ncbi:zinc-binding dehydrogenase [Streptomyces sp. LBL]|uniref:zinc-binding dehydrogenase n=1 Tax=Streptomyces sp. LBL TaxID=2940562 RepID=UPI0024761B21|nr:zinc-binding dehydrogenase [Streptomyces sp. LBL]